jgi:peptidoglycan/xylan/chitin deacetylase (PgdA/CDA1 family)
MIALNYHRIDTGGKPDFYTVDPAEFAKHLKAIRELGLRVVDADEALAATVDDNLVMLLFDDGTEDHARVAIPLMQAEGVRGVFFVNTDKVGRPGYLTKEQIKEQATAGHSFECHGHSHQRMDQMNSDQLERELTTSSALIREWTGRAPKILAPPGGFMNQKVIEAGKFHHLYTMRTMRWNNNRIPLHGKLDCLVINHGTNSNLVRQWLQGRGLLMVRASYLAKQVFRSVLPLDLYLKFRNQKKSAVVEVTNPPTCRNEFLLNCLEHLQSANVAFCISRNHTEFWNDGPSDIDLLISPSQFEAGIHCLEKAAHANGFRLVSQTWFVNLCMVFYAPGSSFVRIDIETDLRWQSRTLLDADAILEKRIQQDGLPTPCPEHEALVLLCKCAWLGFVKPSYQHRLEELTSSHDDANQVIRFLEDRIRFDKASLARLIAGKDVTELRNRFKLTPIPQHRIRNAYLLVVRSISRLCNPPGIIIDCPDLDKTARGAAANKLELFFPTAKSSSSSSSITNIVLTLFRGGIFWNDAVPDSLIARVLRMWSRKPNFRWNHGKIHHLASDQSAEAHHAPDFIGHVLGEFIARRR